MQSINHAACRDYFNQYQGCAICLGNCPFSLTGYEKVKARFKGNPKAPQFRISFETDFEYKQEVQHEENPLV